VNLSLEVSELLLRRLKAFAAAENKSVDHVASECLDTFLNTPKVRRTILKARKTAHQKAPSLSDLGWLEGYSGQTVDELLLLDRTERPVILINAVAQAIEGKLKTQGLGKRTGVERVILAVDTLNREVNNGGYHQFFINSSRNVTPAIVDDLERIGCRRIANITQRALDALGLHKVTVAGIEEAMKRVDRMRDRKLSRCDNAFWRAPELTKRLYEYIKRNRNGIVV
jgi:hypothetical protein